MSYTRKKNLKYIVFYCILLKISDLLVILMIDLFIFFSSVFYFVKTKKKQTYIYYKYIHIYYIYIDLSLSISLYLYKFILLIYKFFEINKIYNLNWFFNVFIWIKVLKKG